MPAKAKRSTPTQRSIGSGLRRFAGGDGFAKPDRHEPGLEQAVDVGFDGAVVFGQPVDEPMRVPGAFFGVIVWPIGVGLLSFLFA
jgi:hypothetical protein